jgi:adenylosuccinate synthase
LNVLAACQPVTTLPGWSQPTAGVTTYTDLPREAQNYVAFSNGCAVSIVSTGSGVDTAIREIPPPRLVRQLNVR